jgi:hypothetical protein
MDFDQSVDYNFVMRLNHDLEKISTLNNTNTISHGKDIATVQIDLHEDAESTSPQLLHSIHEELFEPNHIHPYTHYPMRLSFYENTDGEGEGNSPLTLSNNNSDNEDSMEDSQSRSNNRDGSFVPSIGTKRNTLSSMLTHEEVEQSLGKYYDDSSFKQLNELDILITYLKGQKNLFVFSENFLQQRLNCLLIPCLVISAAITIFAPFIQEYYWSGGLISGLNALIVFFISLSNYLKLESSIQTFHITANQYDKLETSLEFVSSKMVFMDNTSKKTQVVLNKIQDMEKKISEIKEWNPLFLPDEVRQRFPIICHINIFSFIKRMEVHKQNLISNLKDVKNEIRSILYHAEKHDGLFRKSLVPLHINTDTGTGTGTGTHAGTGIDISGSVGGGGSLDPGYDNNSSLDMESVRLARMKYRLQFLMKMKNKIKTDLMHHRNAYGHIDELFTKEIWHAQRRGGWWCYWFATSPPSLESPNPVINDYLRLTFG